MFEMTKLIYILVCSAIFVAFLWGIHAVIYAQSHDFALGVLFATAVIGGLLWLHVKLVGPIS